jgi:hypothetical protein
MNSINSFTKKSFDVEKKAFSGGSKASIDYVILLD